MTIMPAAASPVPTIDSGPIHVGTYRHSEPGEPDVTETVLDTPLGLLVLDDTAALELARQLVAAVRPAPRRACVRRFSHRSTR